VVNVPWHAHDFTWLVQAGLDAPLITQESRQPTVSIRRGSGAADSCLQTSIGYSLLSRKNSQSLATSLSGAAYVL
jgi:hypothetical protein